MRTIPATLRQKLLNRFKAESTDSLPQIRLVATQTQTNSLMSEPIHTDVAAAFGDVAVRQMQGEEEPSLAYAVCLDGGIAKLYRRDFPADVDNPWEYQWDIGPASDAAIEFDGTWKMNAAKQWYYLQTERYPYIFTVEQGGLYVQKWNDTESKELLASGGISQISACRGWQNGIDPELDHGLVIAYLRSGAVYYRTLCLNGDSLIWESERQAESLGSGNVTLAVIRTNDFRIGFLTENGGHIKLALTERNYPGMSVRPETVAAQTSARFGFFDLRWKYGYEAEAVGAGVSKTFLSFLPADTVPLGITEMSKLNRETTWYCYGVSLKFNYPLSEEVPQRFLNGVKATASTGTVYADSISIDGDTMTVLVRSDILRSVDFTLTLPTERGILFQNPKGQEWFFESVTAVFEAELQTLYGNEPETVSAAASAAMEMVDAGFIETFETETVEAAASAEMALYSITPEPI